MLELLSMPLIKLIHSKLFFHSHSHVKDVLDISFNIQHCKINKCSFNDL